MMLENGGEGLRNPNARIGEVFTWERPLNNPGILALIKSQETPFWRAGLVDADSESDNDDGKESRKFESHRSLQLCDVSDDEYSEDVCGEDEDDEKLVEPTGKDKGFYFTKITRIKNSCSSPNEAGVEGGPSYSSTKHNSFSCIEDERNIAYRKKRRFGLFHNQNHLPKDYAGPEANMIPFHDFYANTGSVCKNSWSIFQTIANIPNPAAFKCKRFHFRRNAICDPFNLLMPQRIRERTEEEASKRKKSIFRRMTIFFQVKFGIECEEDL